MPTHTTPQTTTITEPVEIAAGGGQPKPSDWQMMTFASLADAQDMLDSLEAQGIVEREFVVLGKSIFVVKWR